MASLSLKADLSSRFEIKGKTSSPCQFGGEYDKTKTPSKMARKARIKYTPFRSLRPPSAFVAGTDRVKQTNEDHGFMALSSSSRTTGVEENNPMTVGLHEPIGQADARRLHLSAIQTENAGRSQITGRGPNSRARDRIFELYRMVCARKRAIRRSAVKQQTSPSQTGEVEVEGELDDNLFAETATPTVNARLPSTRASHGQGLFGGRPFDTRIWNGHNSTPDSRLIGKTDSPASFSCASPNGDAEYGHSNSYLGHWPSATEMSPPVVDGLDPKADFTRPYRDTYDNLESIPDQPNPFSSAPLQLTRIVTYYPAVVDGRIHAPFGVGETPQPARISSPEANTYALGGSRGRHRVRTPQEARFGENTTGGNETVGDVERDKENNTCMTSLSLDNANVLDEGPCHDDNNSQFSAVPLGPLVGPNDKNFRFAFPIIPVAITTTSVIHYGNMATAPSKSGALLYQSRLHNTPDSSFVTETDVVPNASKLLYPDEASSILGATGDATDDVRIPPAPWLVQGNVKAAGFPSVAGGLDEISVSPTVPTELGRHFRPVIVSGSLPVLYSGADACDQPNQEGLAGLELRPTYMSSLGAVFSPARPSGLGLCDGPTHTGVFSKIDE
ncbi:hypothetical protein BIW11_11423 [Tropilaelaps mercedesae]|uniref:Uncharacterized protein n=1 Tax=Tropilaelaps mercedesae TaxID=418985 RepID=A0A1V9XBE8_9ACAR|nr:hypothetical protein BIW11_11423 [Tropilaelaps mercedesae]